MSTTPDPHAVFGPTPAGWLWGVATAAHQIEGGNTLNDWWAFEQDPTSVASVPSGIACDSWNRWREDVDLIAGLGLNAYRFSVEWARIEPERGRFDDAAIAHYRDLLEYCRERGLATCVTFQHFTLPQWISLAGGADNPEFPDLFVAYVERTAAALGDLIDIACTFNEPNVIAFMGHHQGLWPPRAEPSYDGYVRATESLIEAHRRAVPILRAAPGDFLVGLTVALPAAVVHETDSWDSPSVPVGEAIARAGAVGEFLRTTGLAYLEATSGDDFVGVQTYCIQHLGPDGAELPAPAGTRLTQMDWTFTPEALAISVRWASQVTGLPVYVTENGVATEDDAERIEYLAAALGGLRAAMNDGVDVRGYFHWTLMDNFEWAMGYGPKFGLVAVDRETMARTPKPSAAFYGAIANASPAPRTPRHTSEDLP